MAVSGAINRQKVAISRAINSHFLTFYGAINSQKGRQILYRAIDAVLTSSPLAIKITKNFVEFMNFYEINGPIVFRKFH